MSPAYFLEDLSRVIVSGLSVDMDVTDFPKWFKLVQILTNLWENGEYLPQDNYPQLRIAPTTGGPSSAGSEINQIDWENIGITLDALHEAWEILNYSLRNEDKDLLADKQIWLISKIIPQFLPLELGGAILDAPNARLWGRYYTPPRLGPPTSARPDDCCTESDEGSCV